MVRALCVLSMLAGCYTATATIGLPCSESLQCPSGQACDKDTSTCFATMPAQHTLLKISAGYDHTCGIDPGGSLWCWGRNQLGQLGLGDADDRAIPVHVGTEGDWKQISAGADGTCGLRGSDLYCWGDPGVVGTAANKPTKVTSPVAQWAWVSAGGHGYCAVTTTGDTWCRWHDAPALQQVAVGYTAVAVFASDERQCILDGQQALLCWGFNDAGQVGNGMVGDGSGGQLVPTPTQVAGKTGTWSTASAAGKHTCAIDLAGHLWCWGECLGYQATGTVPRDSGSCPIPAQVGGDLDLYVSVAQNDDDTCAVTRDGRVLCFGANEAGQLGASTIDPFSVPSPVSGTHMWDAVTVGREHACGITVDRNVWCWGYDRYGNLGDENLSFAQTPQKVENDNWDQVAAGDTSTCATTVDHQLWCWGNNGAGQLGDNTTQRHTTPVRIDTNQDWFAVSVGTNHTCGLRGTGPGHGTLYCWGSNRDGQLGLGNTSDETEHAPRQVGFLTTWSEIQSGTMETCGITTGTLFCWGDRARKPSPVQFDLAPPNPGWESVALHAAPERSGRGAAVVNAHHHYAIDIDGSRMDGAMAVTLDDHKLTDPQFVATTLGEDHGCGLASSNGALCWGTNTSGQLGSPDPISGVDDITARPLSLAAAWKVLDAGGSATCGITESSALFCWGSADLLGSPTTTAANVLPREVTPGTTWSRVSVGHRHACATRMDHTLWCWGDNLQGELGTGEIGTNRPIRVHQGTP